MIVPCHNSLRKPDQGTIRTPSTMRGSGSVHTSMAACGLCLTAKPEVNDQDNEAAVRMPTNGNERQPPLSFIR